MVNEIIALSLGLTAGTFFFLAASFPALTIPLISIAVTGVCTLFVFTILKVINTLQAIPAMADEMRADLNDQIDEKYEDLKTTTQDIIADVKNTSVETINAITADFQNAAMETVNTNIASIQKDTINALQSTMQQQLNNVTLQTRKKLGGYNHILVLSDHDNIIDQDDPENFKTAFNFNTAALGTGSAAVAGTATLLSGGLLGLAIGAALGGATAYNQYKAHKKAFLKKTEDNKLHCKFVNDQDEIQEATFKVSFLEEDTVLTQEFLTQHETLILELINLSIIQNNVKTGLPFAEPQNVEPEPEEEILKALAKKPIIFGSQSKGKEKSKSSENDLDTPPRKKARKKKKATATV